MKSGKESNMNECEEIKEFIQAQKCRIFEELEKLDEEIDKFNDDLKQKRGSFTHKPVK